MDAVDTGHDVGDVARRGIALELVSKEYANDV